MNSAKNGEKKQAASRLGYWALIALAVVIFVSIVESARAAPVVQSTCQSSALQWGSTETVSCTVGSETNRALVCAVTYEDNNGSLSTVTYNGSAMTSAAAASVQGTNSAQIFYMTGSTSPALPSSGTYNVVATATSDEASNGGLQVACAYLSGAEQGAPEVFGATALGGAVISDTITFSDNGDILFKATTTSSGIRTATHGQGSWTETMELSQLDNNDTTHTAAYQVVDGTGSRTASTTLSANNSRLVQVVARIEPAFVSPDTGTTISMQTCPGSFPAYRAATLCGPTGSGDCCPPYLTSPLGGPLSDVTVDGEVSTTKSYGTVYACLTESGTTKTCTDIITGNGCTSTANVTPASGKAMFSNITGATAETTYYLQFCQPLDRPDSMTAVSPAFVTDETATGGGSGGGGRNLSGFKWFACDADAGNTTEGTGNDTTGDGLSMPTAYETTNKADDNAATGDDMLLCEGGTFTQTINITWSGTAANPVEIMCYTDYGNDNGDPEECVDF